ncbi:S1 family peptidase [Nocardiopsis sp. CT-R113]|uniref:S1 family peptidase n=1 Tax=Nocardiopsis codii TaxID=3065942 RepID=A0ABU7KEU4_9ACTN|nr:S1 family peptidase [Nocardiopsis sp. CT-R113]MEE2040748.1 S1 family peptidase [Nocardiopsis sp. CT-R113]
MLPSPSPSPDRVPRALRTPVVGAFLALALIAVLTAGLAPAPGWAAASALPAASPVPDSSAPGLPASDPPGPGSTGQAEALAAELGLDPSEARDLLRAQEDAARVDAAASEAAGSAYAGSVFDRSTLRLTVLVATPSAADAVRRTGAGAAVVPRSAAELADVVAALDGAAPRTGVVGWYPDPSDGTVVVETVDGASSEAASLVGDAGVDPASVRVREGAAPAVPYAQVIGGHRYRTGGGVCTIGFAASAPGQPGFLTSGHCGAVGAPVESIPAGATGTFQHSQFPGSDGAFVRVGPGWTLTNLVSDQGGGFVEVTGSLAAPVGSAVCVSSPYNGWRCGTIQSRNNSVSYPEGTVHGLTRTSACSGPGDSGSPFLSGSQAQGLTSGGSGNCSSGGTTFFQNVNPLLGMWGLTLVTS